MPPSSFMSRFPSCTKQLFQKLFLPDNRRRSSIQGRQIERNTAFLQQIIPNTQYTSQYMQCSSGTAVMCPRHHREAPNFVAPHLPTSGRLVNVLPVHFPRQPATTALFYLQLADRRGANIKSTTGVVIHKLVIVFNKRNRKCQKSTRSAGLQCLRQERVADRMYTAATTP